MKERPILFSSPMVRALLDGSKTQTRRVMRYQPDECASVTVEHFHQTVVDRHGEEQPGPEVFGAWWADGEHGCACPYGQPGDRLWVREAWAEPTSLDPGPTFYRADYPLCVPRHFSNVPPIDQIKWKPSIHMRRDQSRITLEITAVRVERLQDITEADAIAEGLEKTASGFWSLYGQASVDGTYSPIASYRALWNSINGPGPGNWETNPWVWAISFRTLPGAATHTPSTNRN